MTQEVTCYRADHPNVFDPAMQVMIEKGFRLLFSPHPTEEDPAAGIYWAKKEGVLFCAEDPLRLLGMVATWEYNGDDYWFKKEDCMKELQQSVQYRAWIETLEEMNELTDEEFARMVEDYRDYAGFRLFPKVDIPENISREQMLEVIQYWNRYDPFPDEEE